MSNLRSLNDVKMTINPDNSIDMDFISSSIHIKSNGMDNYGAKIIAPPCGDGKTTMIKYIMKNYFQYGILVAVDTINEVKMYGDFIKSDIIGKCNDGFTFTEDDYVLLYSGNEDKRFEYIYSSNPMDIMNKHIVVCTHHKFFNNDPRLLTHLNTNINNMSKPDLYNNSLDESSMFYSAMGVVKCQSTFPIRQFILIDELPKCEMMRKRFDKPLISILVKSEFSSSFHVGYEDTGNVDYEGNPIIRKVPVPDYKKFYLDGRQMMYARYNDIVRNTPLDIFNKTREIDNFNTSALLDSFYDKFNYLTIGCQKLNGDLIELPSYVDIVYNLTNLAIPGMRTNLWVFDGTGDLTFSGVRNFDICVPIKVKYSSPITYHRIDVSSSRNFRESTLANNPNRVQKLLDENIQILINVFKSNPNGKILIDTWRDFRFSGANEINSYKFSKYLSREGKKILFDIKSYYYDELTYIVNCMKSNGELGPDFEFSIIHYQSGLDRATNEFREYDSIIFLGEFMVPGSAISEHNINMGCNTDHLKYTLYQLVQAVCRTRIRLHQGFPISVYYTSDWDERYITLLSMYLSSDPGSLTDKMDFIIKGEDSLLKSDYVNRIKSLYFTNEDHSLNSIRPKWRKVIRRLCEYDKNLESAIINKIPYNLDIDFDILYSLIPLAIKERRSYNGLSSQLQSLGVTLNII